MEKHTGTSGSSNFIHSYSLIYDLTIRKLHPRELICRPHSEQWQTGTWFKVPLYALFWLMVFCNLLTIERECEIILAWLVECQATEPWNKRTGIKWFNFLPQMSLYNPWATHLWWYLGNIHIWISFWNKTIKLLFNY